jgi:hypothetical protein
MDLAYAKDYQATYDRADIHCPSTIGEFLFREEPPWFRPFGAFVAYGTDSRDASR